MSTGEPYHFIGDVWLYQGKAAWHFVTLPKEVAEKIRFMSGAKSRGWGSVPVQVTIGESAWKTSIFPDSKSLSYLLPLKADIRQKEKIHVGKPVSVRLTPYY